MPQDWLFGMIGGLLIGCAGALYLLTNGKIMGASGIFGGLIDGSGRASLRERLGFVAGLIFIPGAFVLNRSGPPLETYVTSNLWLLIPAGLLVGAGTRLANGCTSGHGVCGISRASPRGIAATILYIGAGVLTVIALRIGGL